VKNDRVRPALVSGMAGKPQHDASIYAVLQQLLDGQVAMQNTLNQIQIQLGMTAPPERTIESRQNEN
jgi:hypothetical protein